MSSSKLKSFVGIFLFVAATLVACLGVFPAFSQDAFAEEIAVAAASDLNFAIKDLVAEYEKATGHHVKLSLGSSGNFYAQIQNGAPFDLYFSARHKFLRVTDGEGFGGSVAISENKRCLGDAVDLLPYRNTHDVVGPGYLLPLGQDSKGTYIGRGGGRYGAAVAHGCVLSKGGNSIRLPVATFRKLVSPLARATCR